MNFKKDKKELDEFKRVEKALYDYKFIDGKINSYKLQIKRIENESTLSAVDYSKDKLSPTHAFSSEVENAVIRREKAVNDLEIKINNLELDKQIVTAFLDSLEEEELELIKLRYFTKPKLTWQEIAMRVCLDVATCVKYRKAIINKAINERWL